MLCLGSFVYNKASALPFTIGVPTIAYVGLNSERSKERFFTLVVACLKFVSLTDLRFRLRPDTCTHPPLCEQPPTLLEHTTRHATLQDTFTKPHQSFIIFTACIETPTGLGHTRNHHAHLTTYTPPPHTHHVDRRKKTPDARLQAHADRPSSRRFSFADSRQRNDMVRLNFSIIHHHPPINTTLPGTPS